MGSDRLLSEAAVLAIIEGERANWDDVRPLDGVTFGVKRLAAEPERPQTHPDDPDLDATDGAHPAWWRGHDHTARAMTRQLADACGKPGADWQTLLDHVRTAEPERADVRTLERVAEHLRGMAKRALTETVRHAYQLAAETVDAMLTDARAKPAAPPHRSPADQRARVLLGNILMALENVGASLDGEHDADLGPVIHAPAAIRELAKQRDDYATAIQIESAKASGVEDVVLAVAIAIGLDHEPPGSVEELLEECRRLRAQPAAPSATAGEQPSDNPGELDHRERAERAEADLAREREAHDETRRRHKVELDEVYAQVERLGRESDDFQSERNALQQDMERELAGRAEIRRRLGARDEESFPGFVERLAAERDAARAEVERLRATPADQREDLRCVISDLTRQCQERKAEIDRLRAAAEPAAEGRPCPVHLGNAAQAALAMAVEAAEKWPTYNSAHEAFGVLLEEVDELKRHVWAKQSKRDLAAMRAECLDVAAVAIRFAAETCDEERGRR